MGEDIFGLGFGTSFVFTVSAILTLNYDEPLVDIFFLNFKLHTCAAGFLFS